VTCFTLVRLLVRARFTCGEHSKIFPFSSGYAIGPTSGVNPRGCSGRYQSSNSFPRTEKCQETENYAMRYLRRLWQVCSMKLHGVLQMHETVCRLILCPVQLSPKFPAVCFSPKPMLTAPSPKPPLAPLPRLPLLVIPPQTTPAVSAITPTLAIHVHIPTTSPKTYPYFLPFDH